MQNQNVGAASHGTLGRGVSVRRNPILHSVMYTHNLGSSMQDHPSKRGTGASNRDRSTVIIVGRDLCSTQKDESVSRGAR